MKKTAGMVGVIVLSLFSITVTAQQAWEAKNNPTVDSITSKYRDKEVVSKPGPSLQDIFPVIGTYESSTNPEAASISINLDEANKGIAWINGLPQGKVKAMLRKSPSTYKIPAQKTEEGKDVAEGTLIFDAVTNSLRICIGKPFDAENPDTAFSSLEQPDEPETNKTAKVKKQKISKAWIYTGTKIAKETAVN